MTLKRNFLAGLANSIWSALLGVAVVPYYLKYLGVEAYGLIGFFVTTQALLQLLDMGMTPTINREVARCSASGSLEEAGGLLHTLAVVYWIMALVIAFFIFIAASPIAEYWLQSKQLSPKTVTYAVMLIGVVVACRWPIGLYQGALIGAQRQAVSSLINIVMATLANLGAVVVLAYLSPTIEMFFIWQACIGFVYAFVIRYFAWRVIGKSGEYRFDLAKLKNVWRFTAGMSAISLIGVAFTQLDKILLSKFIGLGEFAHYMLATVVVSSLYIIISPVYNAIYPRFSVLAVRGESPEFINQYRNYTRMISMLIFPVAMMLAVYSKEIIQIWTGSENVGVIVAPLVSMLAIGTALNGVMTIPYGLQLAFGMTRLPLLINLCLMLFFIPLIIVLSLKYGALGGAAAWLLLNVSYMLFSTGLMHRSLFKGYGLKWICFDVGVPITLAAAVGGGSRYIFGYFEISPYLKLSIGVLEVLLLMLFGFAIFFRSLPRVIENTQ